MLEDGQTIVALATPEGRGGLAVVRVSGSAAVNVARQLVGPGILPTPVDSHRARLASITWPADDASELAGRELDQALVLPMLAPASFTGEDTVEFFCHGGIMPARMVVRACMAAGARAASAGEFTRRAFVGGRLSLTEAEAVADLIAAEHATGARAALQQLRGGLKRRLEALEQPLLALLAKLEGSLEFGEDEGLDCDLAAAGEVLAAATLAVRELVNLAPAGRRLRDGVQVVLTGAPNVGKSSLFNALVGEDRVIVDASPGTTRDVVSAALDLDGVRFALHDTAGLRHAGDGVEAKGMARTRDLVARADVVLRLQAADQPRPAPSVDAHDDAVVLDVVTKSDLQTEPTVMGLATSSVNGTGLGALRAALRAAAEDAGLDDAASAGIMLNQRHLTRLQAAESGLEQCLAACPAGAEVVASLLAPVLQDLGSVSGRVFSEQLLGEVFSRFCVGK